MMGFFNLALHPYFMLELELMLSDLKKLLDKEKSIRAKIQLEHAMDAIKEFQRLKVVP